MGREINNKSEVAVMVPGQVRWEHVLMAAAVCAGMYAVIANALDSTGNGDAGSSTESASERYTGGPCKFSETGSHDWQIIPGNPTVVKCMNLGCFARYTTSS